jgi:hypothetical protein
LRFSPLYNFLCNLLYLSFCFNYPHVRPTCQIYLILPTHSTGLLSLPLHTHSIASSAGPSLLHVTLPPSQPSAAAADDKRNNSRASRCTLPPPSSLHGGAPYLLPFPCRCGGSGGRQAQRLEGLSVCPPSTFLLAWWRALPPPFPYRCVGGGRQARGGASKASEVSKASRASKAGRRPPLRQSPH